MRSKLAARPRRKKHWLRQNRQLISASLETYEGQCPHNHVSVCCDHRLPPCRKQADAILWALTPMAFLTIYQFVVTDCRLAASKLMQFCEHRPRGRFQSGRSHTRSIWSCSTVKVVSPVVDSIPHGLMVPTRTSCRPRLSVHSSSITQAM